MKIYFEHLLNSLKNFNKKKRFFYPTKPLYYNLLKGKKILIFGNGPSINSHKSKIIKFIKKKNLITFGANNISKFYPVDFLAFTNRRRFSTYSKFIYKNAKLLISPYFKKDFISRHIKKKDYYEIMFLNKKIKKNKNLIDQNNVILFDCRTVSLILILVSYVMGAKEVYLAGLDGYKFKNNKLNSKTNFYGQDLDYNKNHKDKNFKNKFYLSLVNETNYVLDCFDIFFKKNNKKNFFKIITPTCYLKYYDSKIL